MDAVVVMQLVAPVLAVAGIVWHQQHSTDKLRDDFNAANREQREATDKLRDVVVDLGQRMARIEGHLGIGMPPDTDKTGGDGGPPRSDG